MKLESIVKILDSTEWVDKETIDFIRWIQNEIDDMRSVIKSKLEDISKLQEVNEELNSKILDQNYLEKRELLLSDALGNFEKEKHEFELEKLRQEIQLEKDKRKMAQDFANKALSYKTWTYWAVTSNSSSNWSYYNSESRWSFQEVSGWDEAKQII